MTRAGCHAPHNGRSGPTTRDMSPPMGGQERSACSHQAAAADRARSSLEQPCRGSPPPVAIWPPPQPITGHIFGTPNRCYQVGTPGGS